MVTRVVPILRVTDAAAAEAFYRGPLGSRQFRYEAGPGDRCTRDALDGQQVHLSTFSGDSVAGAAV
jgi:catechol 2,3-dioxygenase-like lactoylglutathione lyase family enzyme